MKFTVEIEQETDGRWIGSVSELPGVLVYGDSPAQAVAGAKALALRVLAEKLEHGEIPSALSEVTFEAA
ncbi:MAG: type II toxin-antitoxin system HicB family antitoxin [Acidobacteriota bacterium]